jgi:hypothetical protein
MHSSKQGPEAEDKAAVLIHGDAEECRKHPRHGILVATLSSCTPSLLQ